MNGRLENDLRIEKTINNNLKNMPQFVIEWYNNLRASKKTLSSCNDYIRKIRHYLLSIANRLDTITPHDISLENIQKYFISIQQKEINGSITYTSDSYQQGVWCALNNFCEFLRKRKYIPENYMEYIDKPKNRDLDRINEHRIHLTEDDFKNILLSIECGAGTAQARAHQLHYKERDRVIVKMFMQTGMRKTALSEINMEDLDLNDDKLYIVDKGNKKHTYILSDSLKEDIIVWLEKRNEILEGLTTDAFFVTITGERLSAEAIYNIVGKYSAEALGYRISPHKLRAGFCSILYEKTQNVEFVRRAVGHSNISTTQRYITTDNMERKQAAELMDF